MIEVGFFFDFCVNLILAFLRLKEGLEVCKILIYLFILYLLLFTCVNTAWPVSYGTEPELVELPVVESLELESLELVLMFPETSLIDWSAKAAII